MPYKDLEYKRFHDRQYHELHKESRLKQNRERWVKNKNRYRYNQVYTKWGKRTVKIPRTGICNLCRAVAKIDCAFTHFAHFGYDKNDLAKNVLELCPKCHKYMDGFIKDSITGRFINRGVLP